MTTFAQAADDYLRLRRRLGHDLADAARQLQSFVAYLERIGAEAITVQAAVDWVQEVAADPTSSVWPRRMTAARGFARHMAGIDPRTEVPPLGLFPSRQRWAPPFIYEAKDIATLMAAARAMRWRVPAATYETLIGLLAATGLRVGEALRLERRDIDWGEGFLRIVESKFGKSRIVPVHEDTLTALRSYAETRDRFLVAQATTRFFMSVRGGPLNYPVVQQVFRKLCDSNGIGAETPRRPRVHDLRHSFAVRCLAQWYRAGEDIDALLPRLATYLGHRDPRSTYWYLSASPELLGLAARRLEAGEVTRSEHGGTNTPELLH